MCTLPVDWQVSMKNMVDRVIKLTVIDVDRVRRHNVIGYALLPLKDRKLDERQQLVSLDLQPSDANDVSICPRDLQQAYDVTH